MGMVTSYDEGYDDCAKEIEVWITMVANRVDTSLPAGIAIAGTLQAFARRIKNKTWRSEVDRMRRAARAVKATDDAKTPVVAR